MAPKEPDRINRLKKKRKLLIQLQKKMLVKKNHWLKRNQANMMSPRLQLINSLMIPKYAAAAFAPAPRKEPKNFLALDVSQLSAELFLLESLPYYLSFQVSLRSSTLS